VKKLFLFLQGIFFSFLKVREKENQAIFISRQRVD